MNYKDLQTVKYESFEGGSPRLAAAQRRLIDKMFGNVDRTSSIIDIACGDGVGLRRLKEMGFQDIAGVEFNSRKADLARRDGARVFNMDFHDLSGLNRKYDYIYSSHSLEHAHSPLKVLEQFNRILTDSGKLIVVVPYPDKGPLDAHCGSIVLRTRQDDKGASFISVVESVNFKLEEFKFDSNRQSEIWAVFTSTI